MERPSRADLEHAAWILAAHDRAIAVEARGAVMLGTEIIDEASRKVAESIVVKGRVRLLLVIAGMRRSE